MIDISEWELLLVQGEWFCGIRTAPTSRKFRSVQKCVIQFGLVPDAKGNPRPHQAVLTYPWFVDELTVPEGALCLLISSFHNPREWVNVLATTEQLRTAERAQRAGLHNPKVQ